MRTGSILTEYSIVFKTLSIHYLVFEIDLCGNTGVSIYES